MVHVLEDIFPTFSHPFPGPDDAVLEILTLKCASLSLSRALALHGDFLGRYSPGLCEVLKLWTVHRQRALWEPLLGRLREVSATDPPEACHLTLIEAGLRAHFDGVVGSWVFRLGSPARIRVGRWLLPSVVGGYVESLPDQGISLNLDSENGLTSQLYFRRTADTTSWNVTPPSPAVELPSVPFSDSAMVLLPAHAIAERLLPDLPGARFLEVSELSAVADRLNWAADVVNRHAPEYTDWIGRAIACLAPSNSPKQGSGSHPSFPGLVVMSNDPRPSAVAEMLVHEASHQYFFMATLLGPVDDGSDTQHYYSPLVGRDRPIDKVLLSFHALANMTLLFRKCIAAGIDDSGYCRQRLASITDQMQQVERVLRKTTALTQLGRAMWEPLAARVAQETT